MIHSLATTSSKLALIWLFSILLPSCDSPGKASSSEKNHRAILYFDTRGDFQMDYEGTGLRQESGKIGESVFFKAMHLNSWNDSDIHDEKWVDASFEGTVVTSGSDDRQARIQLKVDNKVPFEIQTMGIAPDGSPESGEASSRHFQPGQHDVLIEGRITGFYEKQ